MRPPKNACTTLGFALKPAAVLPGSKGYTGPEGGRPGNTQCLQETACAAFTVLQEWHTHLLWKRSAHRKAPGLSVARELRRSPGAWVFDAAEPSSTSGARPGGREMLTRGNLDCRGSGLQSPSTPPHLPAHSEAIVVVPVVRIVPVAIGYAGVPRIVVPGPAPQNSNLPP